MRCKEFLEYCLVVTISLVEQVPPRSASLL